MTWFGLYQSASIWLVRAPLALGSHSATTPQVHMAGRPIASRMAPAPATPSNAMSAVRLKFMAHDWPPEAWRATLSHHHRLRRDGKRKRRLSCAAGAEQCSRTAPQAGLAA